MVIDVSATREEKVRWLYTRGESRENMLPERNGKYPKRIIDILYFVVNWATYVVVVHRFEFFQRMCVHLILVVKPNTIIHSYVELIIISPKGIKGKIMSIKFSSHEWSEWYPTTQL